MLIATSPFVPMLQNAPAVVMQPILLPTSSVNHRLPSGPAAMPKGPASRWRSRFRRWSPRCKTPRRW